MASESQQQPGSCITLIDLGPGHLYPMQTSSTGYTFQHGLSLTWLTADDNENMTEELTDLLQEFVTSKSLSDISTSTQEGLDGLLLMDEGSAPLRSVPRMPEEPLSSFNIFFYEQRHRILTGDAMDEGDLECFVRGRYSIGPVRAELPSVEQLVETDSFGIMAMFIVSLWLRLSQVRQGDLILQRYHNFSHMSHQGRHPNHQMSYVALSTFNVFFYDLRHLLLTGEPLDNTELERFVTNPYSTHPTLSRYLWLNQPNDVDLCGELAFKIVAQWRQIEQSSLLNYDRLSFLSGQLYSDAMRSYLAEKHRT